MGFSLIGFSWIGFKLTPKHFNNSGIVSKSKIKLIKNINPPSWFLK